MSVVKQQIPSGAASRFQWIVSGRDNQAQLVRLCTPSMPCPRFGSQSFGSHHDYCDKNSYRTSLRSSIRSYWLPCR